MRRVVAWDTETDLIRPACLAPPLVCVTYQSPGEAAEIVHQADPRCETLLRTWLEDPNVLLVGHNVAYDLAVVDEWSRGRLRELIFKAYDADRIADTQIRQWLLDNAAGMFRGRVGAKGKWVEHKYDLESLAKRSAGMQLQKDGWRLSYGKFLDVPLDRWEARAIEVQAEARITVRRIESDIAAIEAIKKSHRTPIDNARLKALSKEGDGLREMIASDPSRATQYPLDDARATLAVFLSQEKHANPYLADQFRQTRSYYALHLNSAWGLRTDEQGVEALRSATQAELDEEEEELKMLGLMREDGSRDTKVAKARMIDVCKRDQLTLIRTDAHFEGDDVPWAERIAADPKAKPRCKAADGTPLDDAHTDCAEHVCLDGDACEASDDEVLISYAHATTLKKVITNDIAALKGGILYPVHTRYGFAATGRTTSSKPNIQNQSKRAGIREAFIARPGKLFAECDFPSLELYTLAQCCVTWLGQSKLAEALNAGLDAHLQMAASILKMPYDDAKRALKDATHAQHAAVKRMRQLSKPANFGFPGGMGVAKFLSSTRKQMGREKFQELFGATVEEQEKVIRKLKDQWSEAWPETEPYFARVRKLCDTESGRSTVETLFTGRIRGNATYCATANNGFQALGADCAKRAGWLIAKACYVDERSPLFNARPNAMVHDEYIAEVDEEPGPNGDAHDAAYQLARLMVEGANIYLPDVPIPASKMEPLLMRRWSKNAVSTFDAKTGRLVPWMPAVAA